MNLAEPGWLVLLVLLPLLAVAAVLVTRLRRKQWQGFVAPRLRAALLKKGSPLPRWFALFFLLAGTAILIGALARPQGNAATTTEKTLGRNVMIALDLSRSMRVSDVSPDRLAQAKVVIYEMLETMPNDRIGLIGFAGSASLYAPLTVDHAAVRETVEQIDENWVPVGGSDLSSALRLATETLKTTGQKNNVLVLLSDGEEHLGDLNARIQEAEQSGVHIFAIGVGTEHGGFVPSPDDPNQRLYDRSGQEVLSRLQPSILRKLASETGGRFAVAGSGTNVAALVREAAANMDSFEMEGRERRKVIEFFQWLVLPGILLLMFSIVAGTRWRGLRSAPAAATLLGAALLLLPRAHAQTPEQAKQSLDAGRFEEARDAYKKLAESSSLDERTSRFHLGEGTAAYRAQDFLGARSAFSGALLSGSPEVLSTGHLGMGNTLFQLGWMSLANEPYPSDPEAVPDLDRFDTIVREQLAKMAQSEEADSGKSDGFLRMESLIVNWVDAIRHYDSSLTADSSNPSAPHNRATTLLYLKRLQELLKQEEEQTQQSMPEPQPGPGQPRQPGEGEDGEGEPGEQGENGQQGDQEGQGGDQEREGDGPNGEEEGDQDGKGKNPNETEEERARRILEQNSDLERGPLSTGKPEFRNPEKDW